MSSAWVTIWTGVASTAGAGVLGWFGERIWRWWQTGSAWRRDEVRDLRQALDRAMRREMRNSRRENALSTGCELLLLVMPSELTLEQRQVVERSRQLFETALVHHDSGEG